MRPTDTAKVLASRADEVASLLLPAGKKVGHDWCAGSTSGDAGKSLKVRVEGDKKGMWIDFAGGADEKGDLIGLWKQVRGLTLDQANKEALEWLGIPDDEFAPETSARIETTKPQESWKKLQARLRKGTQAEISAVAELRKIPNTAGLELASNANQLWFADVWDKDGFDHASWILTDDSRVNAQARKMDGTPWVEAGKCKTIYGTSSKWPIGISGVNGHDIAFVEGSPDLLAAWHLIWLKGLKDKISPVAMFGGTVAIPPETYPLFAGKTVYLFPHSDAEGKKAGERWASQLRQAKVSAVVNFEIKLKTGKDLNDLVATQGMTDDSGNLPDVFAKMFIPVSAGYTVWRPADFRAWEPPPNVNILGGGYIRRKQLTTLIGPPGVGKSRLSLWMACLHITGRQFFGLDMQNGPAKWLFFGNENDPMRQKSDLDWFYRNLTTEEQAKVDSHLFLHVIDKPDDGIITLADDEAFKKLCITLKEVQPEVVVFDPWGNMIEGNENDNEEVRKTLKLLLRAIQQNCPEAAIVVIHHARTGKSTAIEAGNNYSGGSLGRGSKALVSSARCELALWPGDASDSSKLVLTCEKANNVQKFEPKGLLFENGIYTTNEAFDVEAWRDDIEGNRSTKTLTIKDLVEIIRSGIHKAADIHAKAEEDLGVSKRTVTTRLAEACEKGYLMRTMPAGSYTLGNKKLA